MTKVPSQTLSKEHPQSGYGVCYFKSFSLMSGLEGHECYSEALLGSDLGVSQMDEAESGSSSSKINIQDDHERDDQGWLQLGVGGQVTKYEIKLDQVGPNRGPLIELDLLPNSGSKEVMRSLPTTFYHMPEFRTPRPVSNFYSATSSTSTFPHHQNINWVFRPIPQNVNVASSSTSSSSSSSLSLSSLIPRGCGGVEVAGQSLDFRVIDPPRRPHSGIWFVLQASLNQTKEPFLPQIHKSYMRIKDGKMTVGLLMKYLVTKLRLASESEIEIRCRGQLLLPFLTLKHVRDNIWSPPRRDTQVLTLLPDSSTTDHVMVLHYARSG